MFAAGAKVTPDPTFPDAEIPARMLGKIHTVRKVGRTLIHCTADIGGQKRRLPKDAWLPADKKSLALGLDARNELLL